MVGVLSMSGISGAEEKIPNQWGVGKEEMKVYQKERVIV